MVVVEIAPVHLQGMFASSYITQGSTEAQQVDKMTAPTDGHNTTGEFNPALHSTHGEYTVHLVYLMLLTAPCRCCGH